MSCLVFDIGGTKIRAGLYSHEHNDIRNRISIQSPGNLLTQNVKYSVIQNLLMQQLKTISNEMLQGKNPSEVVVAFPGPINNCGDALAAPTLWGKSPEKFPLKNQLSQLWPSAQIKILNDITAAGYRYLTNTNQSFSIITVSSGIGHKIFINGEPQIGNSGFGGEIGHVVVDNSKYAPICECGQQGHLGAIASGRGVLNLAIKTAQNQISSFKRSILGELTNNNISHIDNEKLVASFHSNDQWTSKIINKSALSLAFAITMLHTAVGIEKFIIIGGFALALGERYRQMLIHSAKNNCWNLGQSWEEMIELGLQDDDHGLLGAGKHFHNIRRTFSNDN